MTEPIFHTSQTAPVKEYRILWTTQKHQKIKSWHDGYLRLHSFNKRMLIYDDHRTLVTDKYHKTGRIEEGDELDFEHHLVTVEEFLKEEVQDLTPVFSPAILRKQQRLAATGALSPHVSPTRSSSAPSPARLIGRGSTGFSPRYGGTPQYGQSQTPVRNKQQVSWGNALKTPAADTSNWQRVLPSRSDTAYPPQPNFRRQSPGDKHPQPPSTTNNIASVQSLPPISRRLEAIGKSNQPPRQSSIQSHGPSGIAAIQPQNNQQRTPATTPKPVPPIPSLQSRSPSGLASNTDPQPPQSNLLDDLSKELAYFEADLEDDDEWDTQRPQKPRAEEPKRSAPLPQQLPPRHPPPIPMPPQRPPQTFHPPPQPTTAAAPPTGPLPTTPARYSTRLPARPPPSAPHFQYDLPPSPTKPPSQATPPPPYSSPNRPSSVSTASTHTPPNRPVPFPAANINTRPGSTRPVTTGNPISKSIPPRPPPPPPQPQSPANQETPTTPQPGPSHITNESPTAAASSRKRIHLPITATRRKRSKLLCMETITVDGEDVSSDEDMRSGTTAAARWRNRRKTEDEAVDRVKATQINNDDDDDDDDEEESWAKGVKRNGGFVSARDVAVDLDVDDEDEGRGRTAKRPIFKPPRRMGVS